MNKKDFKKCVEIVRESIHRIDPYSLLDGGSPDDEFDSEISSIASQLDRVGSGRDAAHTIARVLNSSFSESHKPEEFEVEGNIIFEALVKNGLK